MNIKLFALTVLSLSLFSCKKTEIEAPSQTIAESSDFSNGLPSGKINGYLYACDANYGSFGYLSTYATFGDPARFLYANFNHRDERTVATGTDNVGNVSVGSLQFSGYSVYSYNQGSNTLSYYYLNYASYQNGLAAAWNSTGNKSFSALNLSVARGFPVLEDSLILSVPNKSINVPNGYTIGLNKFISNYDSLYVRVSNSNGEGIEKMVNSSQSPSFSADELRTLFRGSGTNYGFVEVAAFNYSNKLISGKRYVFELGKRRENLMVMVYQ
jgi:hypothetical protein